MSSSGGIYIGTSGWSYPKGEGAWKGYFYPGGRINELEYYSRFFNTVEINSSFYRPPDPGYVYNWARRVPAGFLFTFFNNHWQACAPRNANDLKAALRQPYQQIPMNLEMMRNTDGTENKERAA
ncbi:MAG: DUF72 domain-containing protein [Dehalococcoidales bacterium]|jgi:uncharacterized protein YecE (DUF72 family)